MPAETVTLRDAGERQDKIELGGLTRRHLEFGAQAGLETGSIDFEDIGARRQQWKRVTALRVGHRSSLGLGPLVCQNHLRISDCRLIRIFYDSCNLT